MLDELDQRILDELEVHGYKKNYELASILGIGERTLYRRMKRLRSSGFFKVIAVYNPVLLGIAGGWVGLKVEPSSLISVAHELMKHPHTSFIAYTLGRFDLFVGVHFASMERLSDFLTLELYNIGGIQTAEPMITIEYGKYFGFSWPNIGIDKPMQEIKEKQANHTRNAGFPIDKTDENILRLLNEDGLMKTSIIKSRLGISEDTVRNRIKNMIKNNIFKLEVIVNPEMSQEVIRATTGIVVSKHTAHTVIDRIIENPAVNTAFMSLGRYNIIISTHFRNTQSLNQFLMKTLSSIEGISLVETFLHLKVVKLLDITWSPPDDI